MFTVTLVKFFDEMMDIKEIVDCADSITECYDELITKSAYYNLLGEGNHTVNGKKIKIDMYDLKTLLWKTLMSVNIPRVCVFMFICL